MLITHTMHATSLSMRLLPAALTSDAPLGLAIAGGLGVSGTTLPTYDVRVPAFLKGGVFPGVRAWSPPV